MHPRKLVFLSGTCSTQWFGATFGPVAPRLDVVVDEATDLGGCRTPRVDPCERSVVSGCLGGWDGEEYGRRARGRRCEASEYSGSSP